MKTNKRNQWTIASCFMILMLGATFNANSQESWDQGIEKKSARAIKEFINTSWEMETVMEKAYAYAVFPSVGKGGVVLGGAAGNGILYEDGLPVGDVRMRQVSLGFQWGGQAYSEIILFEDADALERFKSNQLELSAQASAVAVTLGVSADVPYKDGVAIYTLPKGGLMYEAAVGGQKFKYLSENDSE